MLYEVITTNILVDYNEIKQAVHRYDHQIILNRDDPMVPRIEEFHPVITTPGDPTSELLAELIRDSIEARITSYNVCYTKLLRLQKPICLQWLR